MKYETIDVTEAFAGITEQLVKDRSDAEKWRNLRQTLLKMDLGFDLEFKRNEVLPPGETTLRIVRLSDEALLFEYSSWKGTDGRKEKNDKNNL